MEVLEEVSGECQWLDYLKECLKNVFSLMGGYLHMGCMGYRPLTFTIPGLSARGEKVSAPLLT